MSNEKQERIDRIQKTMKIEGNCEYRTNPYTNELADHDAPAFVWVHVNGYHLRACIGHFRAGNFDEICNCAVPGEWNPSNEHDVRFGDPELMQRPPADESVPFDLDQINRYQREQGAKGQCQIGVYVRTIHCTEPATTPFGYGSIIEVCDTHAKWNPFMVGNGKCPDCGELADHYPFKAEENVMLQDEEDAIAALKHFLIEFQLYGTEGKQQRVCQGRDPQGAIKSFLETYPRTQGTIVSICVPGMEI